LCTFACNGKVRLGQTAPGIGEEGKKNNDGEGEFWYSVRTFITSTRYPQYNNSK
jgi:hypothetical protein